MPTQVHTKIQSNTKVLLQSRNWILKSRLTLKPVVIFQTEIKVITFRFYMWSQNFHENLPFGGHKFTNFGLFILLPYQDQALFLLSCIIVQNPLFSHHCT